MFSERSIFRRTAVLILPLILFPAATISSAQAAEATARGRNATVAWITEDGQKQEVAGKEIRYGYFTRTYLKIPKDGRNYRNEEHQEKALPFADGFIRFSMIDKVEFSRLTDPDSGGSRLALKVTMADGKTRTGRAGTLAGATQPESPYIQFEVDGVERRIELLPLSTEEQRRGKPQLVSLVFTL